MPFLLGIQFKVLSLPALTIRPRREVPSAYSGIVEASRTNVYSSGISNEYQNLHPQTVTVLWAFRQLGRWLLKASVHRSYQLVTLLMLRQKRLEIEKPGQTNRRGKEEASGWPCCYSGKISSLLHISRNARTVTFPWG